MKEIWVNIPEYDDYQISNLGRVRSYKKNKITILHSWIANTGYMTVCLDNKKYSIHRLVANAFIKKEKDKNCVNHIDGNKLNNSIDNLEWVTYKENTQHAYKTGLMKNVYITNSKLRQRAKIVNQYDCYNNYIQSFKGSIEAEQYLKNKGIKINARNIRSVCKGKRKTAGGYIWKYSD